jgi:hypothetical protein
LRQDRPGDVAETGGESGLDGLEGAFEGDFKGERHRQDMEAVEELAT